MKFTDLARAQARLQQRALQKEAGVLASGAGSVVSAPFRVAGSVAKGIGKAVTKPASMVARRTINREGKLMGTLMVGGAAVGTAGAAGSAIGKAREYNRGFDPRIQAASMRRVR